MLKELSAANGGMNVSVTVIVAVAGVPVFPSPSDNVKVTVRVAPPGVYRHVRIADGADQRLRDRRGDIGIEGDDERVPVDAAGIASDQLGPEREAAAVNVAEVVEQVHLGNTELADGRAFDHCEAVVGLAVGGKLDGQHPAGEVGRIRDRSRWPTAR